MAILREFLAKLGLDVDATSFAKGELAASGIKLALEKVVEWGKQAGEALLDVAKDAIETAAKLDATSQSIGLSTDALQEFDYVASQASISTEEMQQSITLLSRSMFAAKQGGEEQAKVFSKLGVKITDAKGKLRGADEVIGDVADKISKMPAGTEKTATAMEVFGKSGAKMLPLLNKGSEGIAELRQEARDLGLVLDKELIAKGSEIDDTFSSIKKIWGGIKFQVGAGFFPDILKAAKAVKEWIKSNRELIRQSLESVLRGIAKAGKIVYEVFLFIQRNSDLLVGALEAMATVFLLLQARAVWAARSMAAAWIIANAPLLLLSAALAGILLFIDDFRMFLKYGDEANTLTGVFLKNVDKWMEPKKDDPWWVTTIKEFLGYVKDAIQKLRELDALINGSKMTEQADAAAARPAWDVQRQADTATALTARKRLAANQPLTEAELAALDRLRNTDPSQFFSMPSGNPMDFALRTKNSVGDLTTPTLERATKGNTKIVSSDFSPTFVFNGDPKENGEIVEAKVVPMIEQVLQKHLQHAKDDD